MIFINVTLFQKRARHWTIANLLCNYPDALLMFFHDASCILVKCLCFSLWGSDFAHSAHSATTVFVDNIARLHGVLASIVSDRDRVFTSHFWRKLFQKIGTKLCYFTAYHLQIDEQSKRVNQCLEQYL